MTETMREHFGWIEIVLTAVIALGFGGWQLWSVNREIRRDREKKDLDSSVSRHPIREHELDDR